MDHTRVYLAVRKTREGFVAVSLSQHAPVNSAGNGLGIWTFIVENVLYPALAKQSRDLYKSSLPPLSSVLTTSLSLCPVLQWLRTIPPDFLRLYISSVQSL
jgi:hypothetical protein